MLNNEAVDVLVVEDNDNERESIVEILKSAIRDVQIVAVNTGIEAMDFLLARHKWQERAGEDPPKLILLDLELPGSDGLSILGQIRSIERQDALTLTPVVIFTDSKATGNVVKSYHRGANSYIMKPVSYPDFQVIVKTIAQYWITHNRTHMS